MNIALVFFLRHMVSLVLLSGASIWATALAFHMRLSSNSRVVLFYDGGCSFDVSLLHVRSMP